MTPHSFVIGLVWGILFFMGSTVATAEPLEPEPQPDMIPSTSGEQPARVETESAYPVGQAPPTKTEETPETNTASNEAVSTASNEATNAEEGFEDPNAVLVEWFGLLIGGGHPYLMARMVFFKLFWKHGYFTILDTALAFSVGDMGAGLAAGWRKQLRRQYEIRVGLGLRYGWWVVNTSPWIEPVNKSYPCIPSDSGDDMMGLVLEPQFAFLKREEHVFVGIHVGLPIMVFGRITEFYPHYYSTSNQWSPGIQAGLYTSFY